MNRAAGRSSGLRLLLVEDEYLTARDAARCLTGAGHIVVGPAATLAEGRRLAETEPLDGALLDVKLADADACPLADALLQRGVPVLFLTGYEVEAMPARLRTVPRIEKPFTRRHLLHAVAATFAAAPDRDSGRPASESGR